MKKSILCLILITLGFSLLLSAETLQLNYHRYDKNYAGWGLHVWGSGYAGQAVDWSKALQPKTISDFGALWEIPYTGDGDVQFIIHKGDQKDPDSDRTYPNPKDNKAIWTITEDANAYLSLADAQANAADLVKMEPGQANKSVRLHYIRFDNQYNGWGLHVWGDGYDGPVVNWNTALPPTGKDIKSVYWDLPYKGTGVLNFIVHNGDTKDVDADRKYPLPAINKNAYIITSDPVVYTRYEDVNRNTANRMEKAIISGENELTIDFRSKTASPIFVSLDGKALAIQSQTSLSDTKLKIQMKDKLDASQKYQITCGDMSAFTSLDWKSIDALYAYDGELGCFYTPQSTDFKLWAPLASKVILNLFYKGNDEVPYKTIPLKKSDRGVWNVRMTGDVLGQFYTYAVTNNGVEKTVLDPYAKSMAAFNENSKDDVGRGAVVNPSLIGPKLQYANIDGYTKREDAIIYEVHVRDFTSDPNITTKAPFGTYTAFIEKLDYIKSLGVTHIQLLPILNYYWGDELKNKIRESQYSAKNNIYNWGYDPHNYFTPEGMYSTNPTDPQLRIAELKELINEIHKRGMGVTLDLVYSHTAKMSTFEDIVPSYYYFMDKDGKPKNGLTGSTHAMTRKLFIDSACYLVNEFKIDGFRFDMMGHDDAETMQKLYDKVSQLNPKVLLIGEGWRTYSGDDGDKRTPADQDWMTQTNDVSCFSDEIRNELKSGFGGEGQPRFITGGTRNIQTIFNNISGKPGNMKEDDPGDVVQYIECHDNLTVHDVTALALKLDPDVPAQEAEIQKRLRIGTAMVLTSQGVAFLHAGQEYGRTKQWRTSGIPQDKYTLAQGLTYPYFIHDSYDSSDPINRFDWNQATQPGIYQQTVNYTLGLIKLRRSTDAFRLGTEALVQSNVKLIQNSGISSNDVAVAYQCTSTDGTIFFIFVNADKRVRQFNTNLNMSGAEIIVDDDEAGVNEVSKPSGVKLNSNNSIELEPLTVVILRQKK